MSYKVRPLVKQVYDRIIRPLLPKKIAVFNGIPVRQPRLLDKTDVRPNYEQELIKSIRTYVRPGNEVVIIGGGWGVSTVATAHRVTPSGAVNTFEAGHDEVARVRNTIELNKVSDIVSVEHAIVGSPVRVYSERQDARRLPPEELPNCDVLVLDCEGSEIEILADMVIRPATVIVEAHPMFNAPADDVREILRDAGYGITSEAEETTPRGNITILTSKLREES